MKSSKFHLVMLIVWVIISIVSLIIGWWVSVMFVTFCSLYTIVENHAVGVEASKAKEENRGGDT